MQIQRFQLSKEIIHCDGFVGMPATAQALYLQICSVADDEGFTSQLDMCKFLAHASDDDVKILIDREFILQVGERKVTVVKHWKMNAWLRRIDKSTFSERSLVYVKAGGNYTLDPSKGTPLSQWKGNQRVAQEQPSDNQDVASEQPDCDTDDETPAQPCRVPDTLHSTTPHPNTLQPTTPQYTTPHTNTVHNSTNKGLGQAKKAGAYTHEENHDDDPF